MNKERKPGYYWLKADWDSEWEVAHWNGYSWFPIGDVHTYSDKAFHEIKEEPITPPNN